MFRLAKIVSIFSGASRDRGKEILGYLGSIPLRTMDRKVHGSSHSGGSRSITIHSTVFDQLERGHTFQLLKFVSQFGSFQTLTLKYGGPPKELRADLEAVKEKIYTPLVSDGGSLE